MIDAKRIEEMKRLSAEATPGPWGIEESRYGSYNAASVDENYDLPACLMSMNNAEFVTESRQFVPDIIAAYEEQAEELKEAVEFANYKIESEGNLLRQLVEEYRKVDERDAEIAKLRKALEFYADEDNYGADVHYNGLSEPIYWKSIAENDEGDIAREALK